jgi:hypothetical protein
VIPVPITDHKAESVALLTDAYRDKRAVKGLVLGASAGADAFEAAVWQCINARYLGNATGHALELLGRLVGQRRNGVNDDEFRNAIRIKIAVNNSRGTAEDLTNIVRLLANGGFARYTEITAGVFRLEFESAALSAAGFAAVLELLRAAKPAGVSLEAVSTAGPAATAAYFGDDAGPEVWADDTGTPTFQDDY